MKHCFIITQKESYILMVFIFNVNGHFLMMCIQFKKCYKNVMYNFPCIHFHLLLMICIMSEVICMVTFDPQVSPFTLSPLYWYYSQMAASESFFSQSFLLRDYLHLMLLFVAFCTIFLKSSVTFKHTENIYFPDDVVTQYRLPLHSVEI